MDMKRVANFLIKDNVFSFKLDHATNTIKLQDVLYTGIMEIVLGILIDKYLLSVQGN